MMISLAARLSFQFTFVQEDGSLVIGGYLDAFAASIFRQQIRPVIPSSVIFCDKSIPTLIPRSATSPHCHERLIDGIIANCKQGSEDLSEWIQKRVRRFCAACRLNTRSDRKISARAKEAEHLVPVDVMKERSNRTFVQPGAISGKLKWMVPGTEISGSFAIVESLAIILLKFSTLQINRMHIFYVC